MEKISFVIPCYRSEHTLEQVVGEIKESMKQCAAYSYEIILVNDYSPDDTLGVIRRICEANKNVTGIHLSRNFGQHAALMAGFRYSSGDIVVCLDDDGQTPAEEAGKLIAKIQEGYDVVYAKYPHKKHSLFRNMGSKVNEWMTRFMLEKPKDLYLSSYFAARAFIVKEMLRYEHSYPYIIGLALRATKNITNVEVNHRERQEGASGYTLSKLLGLWLNGFTAFSIKPLRLATVLGGGVALFGFAYGVYTIIKKYVNPLVPLGWSSTMAALMFIGGMLMLMLGLIGEYIGRIYITMNHSPQYVIREVMGEGLERER